MLKRLVVGLILGLVIGGFLGYGLFQLLPTAMSGILAYAFAAVTGVIVGLVAGKPIWAKGGAIEAGLKAFVGALLACGILFGLRFLSFKVPAVAMFPAEEIGKHPLASLMAISTVLAMFYEIDNDAPKEEPKARLSSVGGPKARVAADDLEGLDEEEAAPPAKKRSGS
ncbi:MAG: hypothetical protein ACXVEF_37010 [Polyangiales bacterium]